jgi:hypothetical protein
VYGILLGAVSVHLYYRLTEQNVSQKPDIVEVQPKKEISVPDQIAKKPKGMVEVVKPELEIEVEDELDSITKEKPKAEISEDPLDTIYNFEDTLITAMDSLFIKHAQDNFNDTTYDVSELVNDTIIEAEESEITIKTEEIIASEKVLVLDLDSAEKDVLINDSTLQKLADIKTSPPVSEIIVQFWESPINYSGYKYAGNKLLIYGLEYYPEQLKMYRQNNKLFMSYLDKQYEINEQHDFKAFTVVE